MTTLKDIAAYCGVSVASVSKALNHAPDIGAETAEKIRAAARKLGYHPNAAARALKTNRTYSVGVLFEEGSQSGLTHEFFSSLLDSLKRALESHGYDVTFISENIGKTKMSYLEHCRYRNFDGVVIANANFPEGSVAELVNSEIPVVTIDYIYENRSAVLSDNTQGMKDLLEYVCSMGHRRIAFIHGETTAVTRSRLDSFRKICAGLGIPIREEYIREGQYYRPEIAAKITRELMSLEEPPTCILYPDDIAQFGGFSELQTMGCRVPEDVSLTGYDGIRLSQMLSPKITTIHQDTDAMGTQAAQLLMEAIEYPKTFVPQLQFVPGTLYPGQTVGQCIEQQPMKKA